MFALDFLYLPNQSISSTSYPVNIDVLSKAKSISTPLSIILLVAFTACSNVGINSLVMFMLVTLVGCLLNSPASNNNIVQLRHNTMIKV